MKIESKVKRRKDEIKLSIKISVSLLLLSVGLIGAAYGQQMSNLADENVDEDFGTPGVESAAYTVLDADINGDSASESSELIQYVYLIPGDVVEVTASMNNPTDFISANYGYYLNYLMSGGVSGTPTAMNNLIAQDYEIYQSESFSNAKQYYLKRQIDRNCFVLHIKDSAGDDRNVAGHLKIVIHSKFSSAEHDQRFSKDMNKVKTWNEMTKKKLENPSAWSY